MSLRIERHEQRFLDDYVEAMRESGIGLQALIEGAADEALLGDWDERASHDVWLAWCIATTGDVP